MKRAVGHGFDMYKLLSKYQTNAMRAKDLWIEWMCFEREQEYEAAQSRLRINMLCREASVAWFLVGWSLRSGPGPRCGGRQKRAGGRLAG